MDNCLAPSALRRDNPLYKVIHIHHWLLYDLIIASPFNYNYLDYMIAWSTFLNIVIFIFFFISRQMSEFLVWNILGYYTVVFWAYHIFIYYFLIKQPIPYGRNPCRMTQHWVTIIECFHFFLWLFLYFIKTVMLFKKYIFIIKVFDYISCRIQFFK